MAEIVPVTSEALEAQIRSLLPSQRGFGEDLQASNVITPIIDLTPAALQTQTPLYLQQALAFGSQTAFSITSTTSVIVNTPGFYRIFGVSSTRGSANADTSMSLSDGLSTKQIYAQFSSGTESELFDFTIFLRSGDSLSGTATGAATLLGSSRQVADVNGNLIYPSGYTPQ